MEPNDLSDQEQRTRDIVSRVVSKYSTRNLVSMLVAAFSFGGWATTMQLKLNASIEAITKAEVITSDRLREWTNWRHSANGKIDRTIWTVENHETRISNLEKEKPK